MNKTPKHVAIVMDGNGRWAKQRKLARIEGHEAGAKAVERVIEASVEHKIEALTLFAFGVENWRRPADEVNFLMRLFLHTLEQQTKKLIENNIQLRVIGDYLAFEPELRERIEASQRQTAQNTGLKLVIAANYSGRWDILQAVKKISEQAVNQELTVNQINYHTLHQALAMADLPEPDLLIRTSGEQRISNFLLWQLAYTELYFTPILWPDFDKDAFQEALDFFATRQRRFGLIQEQLQEVC
jgi:undecaprenyl diphosphate synthase